MSRSLRIPSYRKHRQSGQAIVTLPDGIGGRRDVLLGKYRSAQSRQEYARIINEWEASGRTVPPSVLPRGGLTVNEIMLQFWTHAEQHYRRPDGTTTNELTDFRYSCVRSRNCTAPRLPTNSGRWR
jgi:hypothetical protein